MLAFARSWLVLHCIFVHVWKNNEGLTNFFIALLTFLYFYFYFLNKANINQVKWILYKVKAMVALDESFLNQTSIGFVGFSSSNLGRLYSDCTNFS